MLAYLNSSAKVSVRAKYDVTAKSYDELYRDEQYSKYEVIVKKGLYPTNNDRVLDAGCGTCLLYEYFNEMGLIPQYYVGLDVSIGMLNLCLDKNVIPNPKVDLIQADIEYIPFREESFNKIYVITVLDLIENKENTLMNLENLLKDNGILVHTLLKQRNCLPGIEPDNVKDCIYVKRKEGVTKKPYINKVDLFE